MMNILSSWKRYLFGFFTANNELPNDEATVTHIPAVKRSNKENLIDNHLSVKRRKRSHSIDENNEFSKLVLEETICAMPRGRKKNKEVNPDEVIDLAEDEDKSNADVIIIDSPKCECKNKREGVKQSTSASNEIEFIKEYKIDSSDKVRARGKTPSEHWLSSPCQRTFFSTDLAKKDRDRRAFVELLSQFLGSSKAARGRHLSSFSTPKREALSSNSCVLTPSRERTLKIDLTRESAMSASGRYPSPKVPGTSRKPSSRQSSSLECYETRQRIHDDPRIIDRISLTDDDDRLLQEDISSQGVNEHDVKEILTNNHLYYRNYQKSTAYNDVITDIIQKYQAKLAVQEDRAAKIKEDLSAQRKELNDKLCEQFERRLDITERDEQQKEEIKKKKTVQEITPMTEAMLDTIKKLKSSKKSPLVTINKISLTFDSLRTLEGNAWLNDDVINSYMSLIRIRCEKNPDKYPNVYTFNTFFSLRVKKLAETYGLLRRWTRKVDIFACDMIIFPIHLGLHWTLVQALPKEKRLKYFDSMGSPNDAMLRYVMQYLVLEYKDKKNDTLNPDEWELENVLPPEIPRQYNGYDCGVFVCTFAEYLSREAPFDFSEGDMPYFRMRIMYEILTAELLL